MYYSVYVCSYFKNVIIFQVEDFVVDIVYIWSLESKQHTVKVSTPPIQIQYYIMAYY